MSKFPKSSLAATAMILGAASAGAALAQSLELGREATPDEIAAWDIDVRPDGAGLPPGQGDVTTGEEVYTERCSACHGVFGEGSGRWPVLMGGFNTLEGSRPVKTIGSYWPYASTVWDYVHRAMPFGEAQSLSDDEVYAVAAYLLYLNDLVDDDFVATPESYAAVTLPNEDGFYPDDREETELPLFTRDACMSDCKDEVEITMRAAVLDVTPDAGSDAEGGAALEAGDSGVADTAEATELEGESGEVEMALVDEGESLFRQCQACHQVGADARNRVGPHLNGIVGRQAAAVEGFRYSPAMQQAGEEGFVWDAASLAEFLADPKGYMPGTKMTFQGLGPDEAEAMAAYLGSLEAEG